MNAYIPLLCFLLVAPLKADDKKPEPAALDGKWEVVSAEFDGAERAELKGRVLEFGKDEFSTYDGDKKGRTLKFTLKADTDPKGIDLDRGAGVIAEGIYSVTKDELKICYAEPKSVRPKEFKSPAGDKVFLLVLKRKKD